MGRHLSMNVVLHPVFPAFIGVLRPIVAKNVVAMNPKSAIMLLVVESTDHQGLTP
jgi:hypothetical protein